MSDEVDGRAHDLREDRRERRPGHAHLREAAAPKIHSQSKTTFTTVATTLTRRITCVCPRPAKNVESVAISIDREGPQQQDPRVLDLVVAAAPASWPARSKAGPASGLSAATSEAAPSEK